MWCVFGALLWDALWAECVGEVGGVSWLKLLFLFARGDGGGVTFFTGKNR